MRANPITCDILFSPDHMRAHALVRQRRGRLMAFAVGAASLLVLTGLLAIPLFLLSSLLPWKGLSTSAWQHLGILLSGTLRATVCAMLVAVPLGIATAMFTAHFCAARLRAWIKPALEVLDALPTVVLGLVAFATLAPWLKTHVASVLALIVVIPSLLLAAGFAFGARARGNRWLPLWLLPLLVAVVAIMFAIAAQQPVALIVPASPWNAMLVGLVLGFSALPLVFSLAEDALYLVPREQTQAAFALGATRWHALMTVLLPAAAPGLLAAALLGASRCLGETMIVLMASGNTPVGGVDVLTGLRSIGADLALGLPEAAPASETWRSLLLAALVLLVLTVLLGSLADVVRERLRRHLCADARTR